MSEPYPIGLGVVVLVVLTVGVTGLAAILIWRNGYLQGWRNARKASPLCPKCGYNLSGLTQCRCPECGTEYRLDKLWRACLDRRLLRRSGPSPVDEPTVERSGKSHEFHAQKSTN